MSLHDESTSPFNTLPPIICANQHEKVLAEQVCRFIYLTTDALDIYVFSSDIFFPNTLIFYCAAHLFFSVLESDSRIFDQALKVN